MIEPMMDVQCNQEKIEKELTNPKIFPHLQPAYILNIDWLTYWSDSIQMLIVRRNKFETRKSTQFQSMVSPSISYWIPKLC